VKELPYNPFWSGTRQKKCLQVQQPFQAGNCVTCACSSLKKSCRCFFYIYQSLVRERYIPGLRIPSLKTKGHPRRPSGPKLAGPGGRARCRCCDSVLQMCRAGAGEIQRPSALSHDALLPEMVQIVLRGSVRSIRRFQGQKFLTVCRSLQFNSGSNV
jgi:hypothetical protein